MITTQLSNIKDLFPFVYNNIMRYFNFDYSANKHCACRYEILKKGKFKIRINFLGTFYFRKGKFHRSRNKPAIILIDGSNYYYKYGKRHCTKYPAIKRINGAALWYKNNKRHRDDGPAVTYSSGTEEYWYNGQLHREDGPAVYYEHVADDRVYKREEWFRFGKLHRENNPAISYTVKINQMQFFYTYERYYKGNLHSLKEPAIKNIEEELFYINGRKLEKILWKRVINIVNRFIRNIKRKYREMNTAILKGYLYQDLCTSIVSYI